MMLVARTQAEDIDVGDALARLAATGGGGVASFIGVVRGGEGLAALELETYPALAARVLDGIAAEAAQRWGLLGVTLIHRHGRLSVGARIVLAAAAAPHRKAALDACAYLIDRAKVEAPFWKREWFADGTARWIAPRAEDASIAALWR